MAFELTGGDLSWVAAADLSTKQYFLMKLGTSGIDLNTTAGGACTGILQNDPTSGKTAQVRVAAGTISKVQYGGNVAVGDLLRSDNAGKAVAITSTSKGTVDTSDTGAATDAVKGSYVLGQAVIAGAAGEIGSMIWQPVGLVPTTVQ